MRPVLDNQHAISVPALKCSVCQVQPTEEAFDLWQAIEQRKKHVTPVHVQLRSRGSCCQVLLEAITQEQPGSQLGFVAKDAWYGQGLVDKDLPRRHQISCKCQAQSPFREIPTARSTSKNDGAGPMRALHECDTDTPTPRREYLAGPPTPDFKLSIEPQHNIAAVGSGHWKVYTCVPC